MSDGNQNPDATTPDGPGPGVETAPQAGDLAEVQRQRDDYLDQLQRARAEFSNFQKRARAQAEADRAYAVGDLAGDLLAVIDDFERAMEAARASGATAIVEGLELIDKQFLAVLAKHGVTRIAAIGQPFDPNRHEALFQQPDAQHPEGTVVAELGKGYMIRDRVLRPSKVGVSIKPA
jgi:molecular chaperone GrpE